MNQNTPYRSKIFMMPYYAFVVSNYSPAHWKESSALRIVIAFLSFLHFTLIFHLFIPETLITFLVLLNMGALLQWLLDLGLQIELAKNFERNESKFFQTNLTARTYLLLVGTLMIACCGTFLGLSAIESCLLIAFILDAYTDNSINLRQLIVPRKSFALVSMSKRSLQVIVLLLEWAIGIKLSLGIIAVNILFSAMITIIVDLFLFGFRFCRLRISSIFCGIPNLIQSAGTNLSNFDMLILKLVGGETFIPVIAATRRYLGILSAMSSAFQLEIFQKAIRSAAEISTQIITARRVAYFMTLLMIPVAFSLIYLLPKINPEIEINSMGKIIVLIVAIISPWGLINSLQNSVLLTRSIGLRLSHTTFASSLSYLTIIAFSGFLGIHGLGFCFAYVVNWGLEYCLQLNILSKEIHAN